MSSISKVVPSAANFSLGVAPALANLNFDFSLYKVQAPKEFEGVGSALSTFRREEAENGIPHTIARKLGALFERLLPSTPGLTRAYGQRASEISQTASKALPSRSKYGVFSSRVGTDATSIWAAATSGGGAIAVHLLACLLARMWDGSEATAIWVQLVRCRQEAIFASFEKNESAEIATLAAAKQDLPRTQLAEWDASARAWLRAADSVKNVQQTQLMLIIDNFRAPVNGEIDTYESVMSAWTACMAQMESLVLGIPQKAHSGEILLALSAWHLFPDMALVTPCVKNVRQNDPVFASGGILTIGLETPHPNPNQNGVYWSLPLAHLRHYGEPVQSEHSINSRERSRISLEEFLQAALGCFLQGWGEAGANTPVAITWLSTVYGLLHKAASTGSEDARRLVHGRAESSWLNLILLAAKHHLNQSGNERLTASKLISLGRKHGKNFLGLPDKPVFGLLYRGAFVGLIQDEEERISFLRKIASDMMHKLRVGEHHMFIRYKRHYPGWPQTVFEYASATPWVRKTLKRKFHLRDGGDEGHARWLYAGRDLHKRVNDASYLARLDQQYGGYGGTSIQAPAPAPIPVNFSNFNPTQEQTVPPQFGLNTFCSFSSVPDDFEHWHRSRGHRGPFADSDRCYFSEAQQSLILTDFDARKNHFQSRGESVFKREDSIIEDFDPEIMGIFWDLSESSYLHQGQWYRLMYGDLESAALFISEGQQDLVDLYRTVGEDSTEFFSLYETKRMDTDVLVDKLISTFQRANVEADPHLKSLKAVSTAARLYKRFPQATVDIRVLQQKIYDAFWVKASPFQLRDGFIFEKGTLYALEPYYLDLKGSFACITMFESGRYNIVPNDLENVMAMSSGDSLFIGDALLEDPFEDAHDTVQHVAGNIGRAGIAFLVPPVDLMIKKSSMLDWPQLNRSEFDGELKNCFESTSLHLSFTGANSPLNVGFTGAQDSEVYILETLISVHEYGRWIADLNPLMISLSNRLGPGPSCINGTYKEGGGPTSQIMCIDNWLELIDAPEEQICLVRAHKNWQARLAATSLSLQIGFETLVLPENLCWGCFETMVKELLSLSIRRSGAKKLIVIG